MEFKDKCKIARQKLLISQMDFAEIMGVSFTSVNRWEKGKAKPNYKAQRNFREICKKHGIKFEEGYNI